MRQQKQPEQVTLEDIIQAANHDDTLAIELVAEIGENSGKASRCLLISLIPNW